MHYTSYLLTALWALSPVTVASPAWVQPGNPNVPSKRQASAAPAPTIQAERYLHNCKGYSTRERQAWDDANTLAKQALDWQANGDFQPDADLYFGLGSNNSDMVTRISDNLKRAVLAHGRNWIWPDSSIDVWCWENGTEGLPPAPDEATLPWPGACDDNTYAYSYIRKHAYWFHTGYTIVLCPRFWGTVTDRFGRIRDRKYPLQAVLDYAKKNPEFAARPDSLALNRGQTYLHELMHLDDLVGKPVIDDLAYTAGPTARLAMLWGTRKKANAPSFPKLNGEWGSTLNADSYAFFANSIYFREQLKQGEPPQPPAGWQNIPADRVGPYDYNGKMVPGRTSEEFDLVDSSSRSLVIDITEAMDNEAIPVYEPPPPPPKCAPSTSSTDPTLLNNLAAVFCKKVIAGKAHAETLIETDLSPKVKGAKLTASFSFSTPKGPKPYQCAMSCIDTFTNLLKTCQYDSHVVTGEASVEMGCGTWGFTVE